jgi:hypothetical protein
VISSTRPFRRLLAHVLHVLGHQRGQHRHELHVPAADLVRVCE